ncbi:hypothetical protein HZH68_002651 [Vespula germanica]|uniref:Uncharacterized protein n=1 Tax=Vespula germanica TaxID=30212 RepID=A0A834U1D5_VESGE|nr:hypothetical protein HZH68_002651 [Vespula germanica]
MAKTEKNVQKVRTLILSDRRLTLGKISLTKGHPLQLSYLLDLSPVDFFLFSRMKFLKLLWQCEQHSKIYDRIVELDNAKLLPTLLQRMEAASSTLYTL